MFVLVTGRRQGKTHLIVRWFLESPEYRAVIVLSSAEKERFWRNLLSCAGPALPNVYKSHIVVYGAESFYRLRGTRVREFAIENAEQVLSNILGAGQLSLITLTGTLLNLPRLGEGESEDLKPQ